MPRTTRKPRTAIDRLSAFLNVAVEHSGRGKYLIETFGTVRYSKRRVLARLTTIALERGHDPAELRNVVSWQPPERDERLLPWFDDLGGSDVRMLLEVYR